MNYQNKGYFQILVKDTPFFLKMWMWSDRINTTKQLPNGVLALYTVQCFAYMIECLYFFKLFVLAKYHDKSYQI